MESHTCGVSPISTQVHYYDNTKAHWENSCGAFLRSQGSSFCRHLESSNITVRVHPIWNSAFWSAPRHPTGQEYLPPKWRKNAIQSEAWLHICAVSIPKRWSFGRKIEKMQQQMRKAKKHVKLRFAFLGICFMRSSNGMFSFVRFFSLNFWSCIYFWWSLVCLCLISRYEQTWKSSMMPDLWECTAFSWLPGLISPRSSYILGDSQKEKLNMIGSIKVPPIPCLQRLTWKLGNQFTCKI